MALKFTQKGGAGGGSGGTYDHNLLINRGLPDQHTIESITGLKGQLDKKYEKPFSGIPKSDMGFDVATLRDIRILKDTDLADIISAISVITQEIQHARGEEENLREYIDTKVSFADWSAGSTGGSGGSSEVGYPLYEEYRAVDGQRLFPLLKTYQAGTHQLEVYYNGIRMVQGLDYREVENHTVEFLYDMEADDHLLFMVRAVINSGLHEEYTAESGQTVFALTSPYGLYQNILQVFRNGILQQKGRDYREIDDRTVEFTVPLIGGDVVVFHQAGATDPITGTIIESEIGRLKINQSKTTLKLMDLMQSTETDYGDMYVDSFFATSNIDEAASMTYQYLDQGIEVGLVDYKWDRQEEFEKGSGSETDLMTYKDVLRLKNASGGAELNSFNPFSIAYGDNPVDDALRIDNQYKSHFHFISEQLPSGMGQLIVQVDQVHQDQTFPTKTSVIHTTDGYVFGIKAVRDTEGAIHAVYHEQGASNGKAKVLYAKVMPDGTVATNRVISDPAYDALSADVAIDSENILHIVFNSKRITENVFNIDYKEIDGDTESGFINISTSTTFDSLNPVIGIGPDNIARIFYETMAFDGLHKNIKYAEIVNSIKVHEMYVTVSELFDNVTPDVEVDSGNISRLVWRSKRVNASSYGIDYCSVYPNHTITPATTIYEGTAAGLVCGRPKTNLDYEDILHIVFDANEQQSVIRNILYGYVYPGNVVAVPVDIANQLDVSFVDPDISAYGDRMVVSYVGNQKAYRTEKALTNFYANGRYDVVVDSKAEQTKWVSVILTSELPIETTLGYEYRLSHDSLLWTGWKSIDELSSETELGRFLQLRITMGSTNKDVTPEIYSMDFVFEPKQIEVQSIPKSAGSDILSAIVVADFTGDIAFAVSRDGGATFKEAIPEQSVNLNGTPHGGDLVIKATIQKEARLNAWGILW